MARESLAMGQWEEKEMKTLIFDKRARHSLKVIAEQWDQALNRLKHMVETPAAGGHDPDE